MRIQISIPTALVSKVDVYCTQFGYTRSELIREVLRQRLDERTEPKKLKKMQEDIAGVTPAAQGKVPKTATETYDKKPARPSIDIGDEYL